MALGRISSGTIITSAAEQSLVIDATGGIYILVADLTNMIAGDAIDFRAYIKVNPSSSVIRGLTKTYLGAQTDRGLTALVIESVYVDFRVIQTTGPGRSIEWRVSKIA